MRKLLLFPGIILLAFLLASCNTDQNQFHRNMMNDDHMGGGMMQGQSGQNGQSGMMGNQNGQPGMQGRTQGNERQNFGQSPGAPTSQEQARILAKQYLESTGNTGMFLGKPSETTSYFTFPLLMNTDSSRIASLQVNKQTWEVSSVK